MTGLPRSIIKKYGVTKKAWAVYRGSHDSHRNVRVKTRTRSVTSMGKKKKSSGGRGFSLTRPVVYGGALVTSALAGMGVASLAERFGLNGWTKHLAAGVLAGPAGGLASLGRDMFLGGQSGGTSGGVFR